MIMETTAGDTAALLRIVEDSGQFDADGVAHVRSTLNDYRAGGDDALWLTADEGEPVPGHRHADPAT